MEHRHIKRVVEFTNGHRSEAARLLGITAKLRDRARNPRRYDRRSGVVMLSPVQYQLVRWPTKSFLSYSRADNALPSPATPGATGWVPALRDRVFADHRRFSTEPLRIFLDVRQESWRVELVA